MEKNPYDIHVTQSIGINISDWTIEEQVELFDKLKEANIGFTINNDNDIPTTTIHSTMDSKEVTDIQT